MSPFNISLSIQVFYGDSYAVKYVCGCSSLYCVTTTHREHEGDNHDLRGSWLGTRTSSSYGLSRNYHQQS